MFSILASILLFLAPIAHATQGCNAIGWEEPHGVTGCVLYYPAISWIYKEGIASGDANTGKFNPKRTVNRAEFTKLTLLASGVNNPPPPCASAPFPDVPKDAWFAPYVCAAKAKGIIGGFPDGTFKPALPINFANGAKILAKTFAIPIDPNDAQYDNDQNYWYRPYTMALLNKKAVAETISRFDQSLTRGEMAEMLYRLKTGKSSINKPQPPKDSAMYPDDTGMGYEMHIMEFGGVNIYLSTEPDPPFIFQESERLIIGTTLRVKGFAFSHVLQHERCGASGLFEHCKATFTDWAVGLYSTPVSPAVLKKGLQDMGPSTQRFFGGKPGDCYTAGVEGENTETCVVPWTTKKTLVVIYDSIDTNVVYSDLPGITPLSASQAMYARIRGAIQYLE